MVSFKGYLWEETGRKQKNEDKHGTKISLLRAIEIFYRVRNHNLNQKVKSSA
jgi:hypothetical protein